MMNNDSRVLAASSVAAEVKRIRYADQLVSRKIERLRQLKVDRIASGAPIRLILQEIEYFEVQQAYIDLMRGQMSNGYLLTANRSSEVNWQDFSTSVHHLMAAMHRDLWGRRWHRIGLRFDGFAAFEVRDRCGQPTNPHFHLVVRPNDVTWQFDYTALWRIKRAFRKALMKTTTQSGWCVFDPTEDYVRPICSEPDMQEVADYLSKGLRMASEAQHDQWGPGVYTIRASQLVKLAQSIGEHGSKVCRAA